MRIFVAIQAPPTVAHNWTAPNGILNKIVWKGSNPKDLMISGPKVEMPPEGTEMANLVNVSSKPIKLTRRHSHHCTPIPGLEIHQSFLDLAPFPNIAFDALLIVPKALNRDKSILVFQKACCQWRIGEEKEDHRRINYCDCLVSELALISRCGISGLTPKKTKMIWYSFKVEDFMWPMPYDSKLPTIFVI